MSEIFDFRNEKSKRSGADPKELFEHEQVPRLSRDELTAAATEWSAGYEHEQRESIAALNTEDLIKTLSYAASHPGHYERSYLGAIGVEYLRRTV
jgi:hypothetical protein